MRRMIAVVVLAVGACAGGGDDAVTDNTEAVDDGKADTASELHVRVSDTTLWMDKAIVSRGNAFIVSGRTSRNLDGGNAFIADDGFGDFTQKSKRTFEIAYGKSTIAMVLEGLDLFVGLSFVHSASRPDHLTGHLIVRPRVSAAAGTGSSSVSLAPEVTPIVIAGRTAYRVAGRSTKALSAVTAAVGTAHLLDATHFAIDLDAAQVSTLATSGTLGFTATLPTSTANLHATVSLAVRVLGLTAGDPYEVWPAATCEANERLCLLGLPDGALDLAACGYALNVKACSGQLGVLVDANTISGTLATVDARIADPAGFGGDAVALAGADHAAMLGTAVRQRAATRLAADSGLWLLSATARASVLGGDVEATFDTAYAFPLQLVAPHVPVANDVARARQVAADALLAYLATQDYLHSEFDRSYLELTRTFRAGHVQSLREFRETNTSESLPNAPTIDIYSGQWIGAHTEVSIDRTTGGATNVLVELD